MSYLLGSCNTHPCSRSMPPSSTPSPGSWRPPWARAAPPAAAGARAAAEEPAATRNLEMVMRIPVTVKIVLGSATMPVANLVRLGRGAVIPLDRRVGEPVDMVVNGRVVARGEVVVVDEATRASASS